MNHDFSGKVRFPMYDAGYEGSVAALRDAMGDNDFGAARAEGAALSPRRRSRMHSVVVASGSGPQMAGRH